MQTEAHTRWEILKNNKLTKYYDALEKGLVDEKVIPLLNIINSNDNYVTTSSCSGRIIILRMNSGKKDSSFYRKWHRQVTYKEVWDAIQKYDGNDKLWFKVESFILHLYAKNVLHAQKYLAVARQSGVKRGGIYYLKEFPFIELFGTEGIYFPVYDKENLVTEKYMMYITTTANRLLNRIYDRLKLLTDNSKMLTDI